MNFCEYINQEVIVKRDDDFSFDEFEGVLIKIIPAHESNNRVETLVIDTGENKEEIPTNKLLQFLPKSDLNNDNTEYYYVVFRYGKTERSKEHIYMSLDYSIKPGDKVLVWKDWLYVGNVIRTGFYKKCDAPYPVEKTWLVQQRVYDRIDFMKYEDSRECIKDDNLYKDNYLNSENDYKQYVSKVDYEYQWLVENHTEHLENRKPSEASPEKMVNYIVGETEYNLDWEWCESNQLDVFYRTLWICTYIAKYKGYHKLFFDKYKCLVQIYKHGDFDSYLLCLETDKVNINRDVTFLEEYILNNDII